MTGRRGRIDVAPDLTVSGFDGVYAPGDFANIAGSNGKAIAAACLGWVEQAGKWCAQNILADAQQESQRQPFAYFDKGIMAMILDVSSWSPRSASIVVELQGVLPLPSG